jgi:hypothetical protein
MQLKNNLAHCVFSEQRQNLHFMGVANVGLTFSVVSGIIAMYVL